MPHPAGLPGPAWNIAGLRRVSVHVGRRRTGWTLALVGAGVALLGLCCLSVVAIPFVPWPRTFVRQPDVDVVVTGPEGPIEGARVTHTWWSHPHSQVRDEATTITGAGGRLRLQLETEEETIMPLCMHGVPEHHHTVCVEAEGYRPVAFEMHAAETPVRGELTMREGEPEAEAECGGARDGLLAEPREETSLEGPVDVFEPMGPSR